MLGPHAAALTTLLAVSSALLCALQTEPGGAGEPAPVALGPKRQFVLFPGGDYYPPNTPDPHHRGFAVQLLSVSGVDIDDSGKSRFGLKLGGRFGLLRLGPEDREHRGWQLGVEVGFYGQFDNDHSQDNIGWDGFYGLVISRGWSRRVAWKLGAVHTSSHVGDELKERTGRERIGYTREELVTGLSWRIVRRLRLYTEAAYAYERRNQALQEPGRGQFGAVYEAPGTLFAGRLGWYVGHDLSAWEERDWELDVAVQAGLLLVSGHREWRLGLEHYSGRPPMGEFFFFDETYTALGLWLDVR